MPFYLRPHRRIRPGAAALIGAAAGLVLCLLRLVVLLPLAAFTAPRLALAAAGEALLLSVLSGAFAGAAYFVVDTSYARRTPIARGAAGVACVAAFVTAALSLLSILPGPLPQVPARAPAFLVFLTLYVLLLGWVVGQDLFAPADMLERYYLTPAQVAALPSGEQAALTLADTGVGHVRDVAG